MDGVTDAPAMKVVFDTTILIDGLFVPGSASAKALREVKYGRLQLITSPSILGEFQSVAQNQRFHQSELRAWLLATGIASLANVTVVQPHDIPRTVPGDALDDHVIAAAVAGGADLIVSTDHHLLDVRVHQGIRVVTPEEFLVILGLAKPPRGAEIAPDTPAPRRAAPPERGDLAA